MHTGITVAFNDTIPCSKFNMIFMDSISFAFQQRSISPFQSDCHVNSAAGLQCITLDSIAPKREDQNKSG